MSVDCFRFGFMSEKKISLVPSFDTTSFTVRYYSLYCGAQTALDIYRHSNVQHFYWLSNTAHNFAEPGISCCTLPDFFSYNSSHKACRFLLRQNTHIGDLTGGYTSAKLSHFAVLSTKAPLGDDCDQERQKGLGT